MGSYGSRFAQIARRLSVLVLLFLCPAPALAHKLNFFIDGIEGATIHGHAYFPDDVPARHSDVIARDASGRELGRTTTDDRGEFALAVREHVDIYLTVATPDGHVCTHTIHASDLPEGLPMNAPVTANDTKVVPLPTDRAAAPATATGKENDLAAMMNGPMAARDAKVAPPVTDHAAAPAATTDPEKDLATIESQLVELTTQFKLLRRQVADSDEGLRLRDFLGGVGFILGLFGVAFYMKARRRQP